MTTHWRVEILNEAVEAELDAWPTEVRAALLKIVERIEAVGLTKLREPHVKHIQGKLWEMRPSAAGNDGRALYLTAKGSRVVIVAAFMKKSRKAPKHMIELALERAKGVI
jgi:phage-related protein